MFSVVCGTMDIATSAWKQASLGCMPMETPNFLSWASFRPGLASLARPRTPASSSSLGKDVACWDDRQRGNLDYSALVLKKDMSTRLMRMQTSSQRTCGRSFSEVFTGVGCLRDYRLQLHMDDPSVTPVAQKPRRVPFALREKGSEEIKDLIEKDMEEVPGPTTWASPIVVSPKASGDIRLCVDMRVANTAIQRERLPIPTVDEALEDLNGSTVFTKLDFNFGFHQIELAESSHDVTTFCTQDGQVLADCPGTVNIAEDIVVHGRTTEEHDRRLLKVLERLHERGLTLNSKKCSFRMPRVEFMGFLLSVHGIGPTAEKVRAVTEAEQPKNAANPVSHLLKPGNTSLPSENEHLFMVATHAVPSAVQARDLKEASAADPELTDIRQRLKVRKHTRRRHEFTFIGQLIMRGTHIALPSSLRSGVLQFAHEGHLGMVKVKTRLLEKVWWPSIDKDVETTCRTCICCQVVGPPPAPQPPVQRTPFPSPPWSELAVDIFGPLPSGESTFAPVYFLTPLPVLHPATEVELCCSSCERRLPQYLADFDCWCFTFYSFLVLHACTFFHTCFLIQSRRRM